MSIELLTLITFITQSFFFLNPWELDTIKSQVNKQTIIRYSINKKDGEYYAKEKSREITNFNEDGTKSDGKIVTASENLNKTIEYIYNEKKQLYQWAEYSTKTHNLKNKKKYFYNNDNELEKVELSGSYELYTYDTHHNLVKRELYIDQQLMQSIRYIYENETIVETQTMMAWDPNRNFTISEQFIYQDNLVIEKIVSYLKNKKRVLDKKSNITYDNDNNPIKIETFDKTGILLEQQFFKYDLKGNIIEYIENKQEDGMVHLNNKIEYIYEYRE